MAKKIPGQFNKIQGRWNRGDIKDVPPDHLSDDLNNCFDTALVRSRDSSSSYLEVNGIVRTALYKPNPPFTGTHVPRELYLRQDGNLYDYNFPGTPIFGNAAMKDFALVNFFGRCYISPHDGRVGLQGQFIDVYDGTGPTGFRTAAGVAPTIPLTGHVQLGTAGPFNFFIGTHLFSYSFETPSGFITRPAPFLALDTIGGGYVTFDTIPLGPVGTVARWIIGTQGIILRADLSIPFDVTTANFYPQFFAQRIPDNTTTSLANFAYYEDALVESSDYLQTLLPAIPAGVGLLDFKGRMISYGEYDDPSIVRASTIGEPESFSETSGFFITDPADSTGVRSATEFRNNLYVYKQQRGYVTQDNQNEASTWDVVNFEKSIGTEQYGIAAILDAKGSSTEGFIIASRGAMVYFNGTVVEPELSYKIRDLWKRINPTYFYRMQLANDPINRRLYALVPLNDLDDNNNVIVERTTCSHLIFGDYRDGLDPFRIKWSLWQFVNPPISILIFNEFTEGVPALVTRLANDQRIVTLNIGQQGNDVGVAIDCLFTTGIIRFADSGLSQYDNIRIDGSGPCRLELTLYGKDNTISKDIPPLSIIANPGREFDRSTNLVTEEAILKVRCATLDEFYKIFAFSVEGKQLWQGRPR